MGPVPRGGRHPLPADRARHPRAGVAAALVGRGGDHPAGDDAGVDTLSRGVLVHDLCHVGQAVRPGGLYLAGDAGECLPVRRPDPGGDLCDLWGEGEATAPSGPVARFGLGWG